MWRLLVCSLLLFSFAGYTQRDSPAPDADTQQLKDWLNKSWDYRFHQPDSARQFGLLALQAARQGGYTHQEAEALHNIGVIEEAQGNYPAALQHAHQALELYKQLGEETGIANACNNIGIIHDQQGNFTEALVYYNEAYTRFKASGDPEKQALVSVNLGILFKAQGAYAKVIRYYHDAYAAYRQLGMPAETAFCEANLGSVYYYTRQYDSCLHYSLLAEKAFTQLRNLQFLPVARCNAGMAYYALNKREEARNYLQLALEGNRRYNNRKETSFVLLQLAKIHGDEKHFPEAIRLLREAKAIAEQIGASQQVMEAAGELSAYYASAQSFRNAWQELRHATRIKDSLFEQEKTKIIADYQTRYETEKKEQQISLLQQQADIQQLTIRQRNYLLISLVAFIGLGIVFIYLMMNRRKLKINAQLQQERHRQQEEATRAIMIAEERERRRIAADLHDGVGQTVSAALMHLHHLQGTPSSDTAALQAGQKAMSLLQEGYEEIRHLSHRMMPKALLRTGLPGAVRELFDNIPDKGIRLSLHIDGFNARLPEQTETVLYRIIQEAMQNALKHAGASNLNLQLTKEAGGLYLNIEDDGKGFDPLSIPAAEGMGLKNLFSRVALLKGAIEIDSGKGRGTLIAIFIPPQELTRSLENPTVSPVAGAAGQEA